MPHRKLHLMLQPSFLQVALACAAMLALSACERGSQPVTISDREEHAPGIDPEFAWARAAIARNPQLELVATDVDKGVLTVRDRSTGEVQVLKPDDLAAVPIAQLRPRQRAASAEAHAPGDREQMADAALDSSPPDSSRASAERTEAAPAERPAEGQTTIEGRNYTIERSNGRVRVSGPGVSIVSSGPVTGEAGSGERGRPADEPIICEGRRMVHLDSRDLYVQGDAIVARGGCELYITNSRIVATGTGIVVKDATVHVSNSHVAGAEGPFDADDRARLYVRSSTFEGVPKRTKLSMVQDQGGNRWR